MLDHIILISFAFLAFVVLQIVYLGKTSRAEDAVQDELDSLSRTMAIVDLTGIGVVCVACCIYVQFVVVAGELRKRHGDPGQELDDASGHPSRTQVVGRFSQSGLHTGK